MGKNQNHMIQYLIVPLSECLCSIRSSLFTTEAFIQTGIMMASLKGTVSVDPDAEKISRVTQRFRNLDFSFITIFPFLFFSIWSSKSVLTKNKQDQSKRYLLSSITHHSCHSTETSFSHRLSSAWSQSEVSQDCRA